MICWATCAGPPSNPLTPASERSSFHTLPEGIGRPTAHMHTACQKLTYREHAEDLLKAYWGTKPKADAGPIAKKPRNSRTAASATPAGKASASQSQGGKRGGRAAASGSTTKASAGKRGKANGNGHGATESAKGGRKRKGAPVEEVSDAEPGFDESHVDSVEKYKDVADWETKVLSIDTIERSNDGVLQIYMTMCVLFPFLVCYGVRLYRERLQLEGG